MSCGKQIQCQNFQDCSACPLVPWKTTFDNNQQKMWCPYTQQVDYNLRQVFTGGNDPAVSKALCIEPFSYLAGYREGDELNNSFMGPICMSGECKKTYCPPQFRRADPVVDPMAYRLYNQFPGYTGAPPCGVRSFITEDYKPMTKF